MENPREGFRLLPNGEIVEGFGHPCGVDGEVQFIKNGGGSSYLVVGEDFFWTKNEAIAAGYEALKLDVEAAKQNLAAYYQKHSDQLLAPF